MCANMKDKVITDISQVNLDWLNLVLKESAALFTGSVWDFDVEVSSSDNAHIANIRLRYEPGATGDLPESLLLKMCSGNSSVIGPSEINYHAPDYVPLANPPIPTCYHARYSAQTGFISSKYVTDEYQPIKKSIRHSRFKS